MIRVIAGEFKGRKLITPNGDAFRPTLDRVKESIFNVLGADVLDRKALDLFCGSGSLGIEALSRGADSVVFVDISHASLELAKKNVALLNLQDRASFWLTDVFRMHRANSKVDFDLVFADPPYNEMWGNRICEYLQKNELIAAGGIFILEHYKKDEISQETFGLIKQLKFGQTAVDFFIRP